MRLMCTSENMMQRHNFLLGNQLCLLALQEIWSRVKMSYLKTNFAQFDLETWDMFTGTLACVLMGEHGPTLP